MAKKKVKVKKTVRKVETESIRPTYVRVTVGLKISAKFQTENYELAVEAPVDNVHDGLLQTQRQLWEFFKKGGPEIFDELDDVLVERLPVAQQRIGEVQDSKRRW